MCVYIYIYIYIRVCVCVRVYVCMSVCVYVCMYVCMHVSSSIAGKSQDSGTMRGASQLKRAIDATKSNLIAAGKALTRKYAWKHAITPKLSRVTWTDEALRES